MKLPRPEGAVIPREKLEGYLLSPAHPVGRHKAAFFGSLGYTQAAWETLEKDIRGFAVGDVARIEETDYGTKYEVPGSITGPNGWAAAIVTAWIVLNAEDFPRFITAYPQD